MALFRKLFYRKPPDGLLEICDRVFGLFLPNSLLRFVFFLPCLVLLPSILNRMSEKIRTCVNSKLLCLKLWRFIFDLGPLFYPAFCDLSQKFDSSSRTVQLFASVLKQRNAGYCKFGLLFIVS